MMMKCLTLTMKNGKEAEISSIKIHNNLNLNNHIKSICRKVGQKLSALLRISSNLNMSNIQMFRSRQPNNLINKIHERSLRISLKIRKTVIRIFLKHLMSLRFIKEICKY